MRITARDQPPRHCIHHTIDYEVVDILTRPHFLFSSVSDPDQDSIRSVDPHSGSGLGFIIKEGKKFRNFMFGHVLDVLFWRLRDLKLGRPLWTPRDKKMAILYKKYQHFFSSAVNFFSSAVNFFSNFGHQNLDRKRIGFSLKCWIRIRKSMYSDPKHWFSLLLLYTYPHW